MKDMFVRGMTVVYTLFVLGAAVLLFVLSDQNINSARTITEEPGM